MTPSQISVSLRHALDYWQHKRDTIGGLPHRRDIDIVDLKPCLGRMLLLKIADPIEDSRYRVYGTILVEYFGEELTNKRLGDIGWDNAATLID